MQEILLQTLDSLSILSYIFKKIINEICPPNHSISFSLAKCVSRPSQKGNKTILVKFTTYNHNNDKHY